MTGALIAAAVIGAGTTYYQAQEARKAQKSANKSAEEAQKKADREQARQFDMATLQRKSSLQNMREGLAPTGKSASTITDAGIRNPALPGGNILG